jgi:hypothetical protein
VNRNVQMDTSTARRKCFSVQGSSRAKIVICLRTRIQERRCHEAGKPPQLHRLCVTLPKCKGTQFEARPVPKNNNPGTVD